MSLTAGRAFALCQGEDGGGGLVTEISEGDTLILEDGRAVRPTGIIGPKRARGGPSSEARLAMETAMSGLVLGKKIALRLDQRKRDRYGRMLAQVMILGDGAPVWLQGKLVEAGLARVISFPENRLCVAELLAKEEESRAAQRGLWKSGFFAVRQAQAQDVLATLAQSYEIVEGRVSTVKESRGRTYINFGQDWRQDFTVFISEKSAGAFAGTGTEAPERELKPAELTGRRVRVRGWIKNFNGPSISVSHPEQIEILDSVAAIR
ncbi:MULTISPECIES: thermonuclease family protein [Rhodomicrobium]|uniref:thermonuclease family protein n=1 Tax=Rhodomicrobium TaxID=1068 RepID=UPI000F73BD2B|nr:MULTISPECIES: thermonuclease family protein [Rhodomicrobium]